jgi:transposase InsO family protein
VLSALDASPEGLATGEAARRLAAYGPNQLPAPPGRNPVLRFLAQFNNALIYFLLTAAVVAWFMGHRVDAGVIVAVVLVNAVIGFVQEGKAEKALEAIRGMVSPHASVLRDGRRTSAPATELVPGDIVLLEPGDRVPADLRLSQARGLLIDEAILTGESVTARVSHEGRRGRYGSPRIHAELRAQGRRIGRKRVARLMRGMGLSARRKRRFRRTTDSAHALPVAPNRLARGFTAAAPDHVWLGDLTYIGPAEGWLYLAVMLDLFSRRIVGWAMADHLRHELALAALDMAIARQRPSPGLVHHSDRGVQYAAHAYRERLRQHGMLCSMSRKGGCWDNASTESFFAALKGELVEQRDHLTRNEARADVFQYVEGFYNRRRLHSGIGYLTPEQKIAAFQATASAA